MRIERDSIVQNIFIYSPLSWLNTKTYLLYGLKYGNYNLHNYKLVCVHRVCVTQSVHTAECTVQRARSALDESD